MVIGNPSLKLASKETGKFCGDRKIELPRDFARIISHDPLACKSKHEQKCYVTKESWLVWMSLSWWAEEVTAGG